jgi:hypothetical protein
MKIYVKYHPFVALSLQESSSKKIKLNELFKKMKSTFEID